MSIKIYQTPYLINAIGQLVVSTIIIIVSTIITIALPVAVYNTWIICGAVSMIFILLSIWNFLKHRRVVKMLGSKGIKDKSLTTTQIAAINEVGVIFTESLLNLKSRSMAQGIWDSISSDVIFRIKNCNQNDSIDLCAVIKHSIAGILSSYS